MRHDAPDAQDVRATTKFHASAADLARRNQNREWEAVAAYLDAVN